MEGKNVKSTYRRKLSVTEANRHYVYIEKQYRDIFPPFGETIRIIIDDYKVEAKIDRLNRIWASLFWDHLDFEMGKTIVFTKNPDGSFNVSNKE